MAKVSLTIDGQKVTVPEDYTIIQASKELGIDIPALCYDPNLEVVSSCRLCVVEIEGNSKLQTSCSIPVSEGMVVNTQSQKVIKTRKNILELLLDNHPNDCLTCQKAGECLLQKYAYEYDVKFREHQGERREPLMDTSSPYILKDDSKCILCGKCVRTCGQINERSVLSFAKRGFQTRVVADADFSLEESKCVSCNRCVAVCPVGALTDKRLMKKTRAWDTEVKEVTCKSCDYGCSFEVLSSGGKNTSVRAKAPSNGRPLCLKGRLTTEIQYLDNPETPYKKEDGKFVETSWTEALELEDIITKINCLNKK